MIIENVGRVLLMPQGEYDAGKAYRYLDIVSDSESGCSYLYKSQTPSTGMPLSNREYWQLFGDVRAAVKAAKDVVTLANNAAAGANTAEVLTQTAIAKANDAASGATRAKDDTIAATALTIAAAKEANEAKLAAEATTALTNAAAKSADDAKTATEAATAKANTAAGNANAQAALAGTAAENANTAAATMMAKLGGLTFAVNAADGGLDITYTRAD